MEVESGGTTNRAAFKQLKGSYPKSDPLKLTSFRIGPTGVINNILTNLYLLDNMHQIEFRLPVVRLHVLPLRAVA